MTKKLTFLFALVAMAVGVTIIKILTVQMKKLTIILFAFTVLATVARGQGKSKAEGDTSIMLSTGNTKIDTRNLYWQSTSSTLLAKSTDWNKTDTIAVTLIVPFRSQQYSVITLREFAGYIVIKKYGSVTFVIAGKNHYVTPAAFLNKFKKPFELPVLYWIED